MAAHAIRLVCRPAALFAAVLAATFLLTPTASRAQTDQAVPVAEESPGLVEIQEKLSEIVAGQKELSKRLDRLESALERTTGAPSDYSQVVVRVESPEGKPLAGYRAKLRLAAAEERAAAASGTSDEAGVAIDRPMPYGEYNLSLREASGWSAYLNGVLVEVGEDTELVVVAPDPADRGRLILRSGLRREAFAGLPFGEIHEGDGLASYVLFAAEPNQLNEAKTFPTVDRGIEEVGAVLSLSVTRKLKQPDDRIAEWRWSSAADGQAASVLVTSAGLAPWPDVEAKTAKPVAGTPFFAADLGSQKKVAYRIVRDANPSQEALTFDIPVGDVLFQAVGVYGRAAPNVVQALDIKTNDASSVWLNANLQQESQWTGRLFDLREWEETADLQSIVRRTIAIEAGDETTIELASP